MYRRSWEGIQEIIQDVARVNVGAGGVLSVQGPYNFAPMLWLDFLNADPHNSQSMWTIYREFARSVEDLRDWMAKEGYPDVEDMKDMKLMSKEEFLERYPGELQSDAEKLHTGMRETIDQDRADVIKALVRSRDKDELSRAKETITKGIHVPPLRLTIDVVNTGLSGINAGESNQMQLHTPEADHPNFWLAVILGGMLSSCKDGKINVRRCAAPDCQKYFVPYPRGRAQKYHSSTCRNRHNTQKRRKSNL